MRIALLILTLVFAFVVLFAARSWANRRTGKTHKVYSFSRPAILIAFVATASFPAVVLPRIPNLFFGLLCLMVEVSCAGYVFFMLTMRIRFDEEGITQSCLFFTRKLAWAEIARIDYSAINQCHILRGANGGKITISDYIEGAIELIDLVETSVRRKTGKTPPRRA